MGYRYGEHKYGQYRYSRISDAWRAKTCERKPWTDVVCVQPVWTPSAQRVTPQSWERRRG